MNDSPEDASRPDAQGRHARLDDATPSAATHAVAASPPSGPARGSRRAVRRAGTVGTDESVLRSRLPAAPEPATTQQPRAVTSSRSSQERSSDPATSVRSLDDSDVGWGRDADSNDDRLRRDRPPHW